ncbi:MAG: hypothetical protein PHI29_01590 [Gallionella sp.]|nr:hypothetical protein [Gallionella sp.]
MDIKKLQAVLMSRGIRVADDDPVFTLVALNEVALHEIVDAHQRALAAKVETLTSEIESSYSPEKMKEVASNCGQALLDLTTQLKSHLEASKQEYIKEQKLQASFQSQQVETVGRYAQKQIRDDITAVHKTEMEIATQHFRNAFDKSLQTLSSMISEIEKATAAITGTAKSQVQVAETKILTRERIHKSELKKWILLSFFTGGVSAAIVSVIALKIML